MYISFDLSCTQIFNTLLQLLEYFLISSCLKKSNKPQSIRNAYYLPIRNFSFQNYVVNLGKNAYICLQLFWYTFKESILRFTHLYMYTDIIDNERTKKFNKSRGHSKLSKYIYRYLYTWLYASQVFMLLKLMEIMINIKIFIKLHLNERLQIESLSNSY